MSLTSAGSNLMKYCNAYLQDFFGMISESRGDGGVNLVYKFIASTILVIRDKDDGIATEAEIKRKIYEIYGTEVRQSIKNHIGRDRFCRTLNLAIICRVPKRGQHKKEHIHCAYTLDAVGEVLKDHVNENGEIDMLSFMEDFISKIRSDEDFRNTIAIIGRFKEDIYASVRKGIIPEFLVWVFTLILRVIARYSNLVDLLEDVSLSISEGESKSDGVIAHYRMCIEGQGLKMADKRLQLSKRDVSVAELHAKLIVNAVKEDILEGLKSLIGKFNKYDIDLNLHSEDGLICVDIVVKVMGGD